MLGSRYSKLAQATGLCALLATLILWAPQAPAVGEGRYIVVFEESVDQPAALARAQTEQHDAHLGFIYTAALKGYSATMPKGEVEALRQDPRVKAVRADREIAVPAAQTNPTGVKRVFAVANNALKIDEAANFTVNADVAVIDTGIAEHKDLLVSERVYCNEVGGIAECKEKTGNDENGHGTHVAGTLAAIDNTEGVVGVAPSARLWGVKVLDPKATEAELVAAVNWVTSKSATIEVANMSIGCLTLPCTFKTMGEAISKSVASGVVYVVAAGNNDGNASESTFGTNPDVITVSALADFDGLEGYASGPTGCREEYEAAWGEHLDDELALFSNSGKDVEIAAPGVCIYSTVLGGGYNEKKWWGTSMASPHVAGAAAILAAQSNPNTKEDVEKIRKTILEKGNEEWEDTSGDKIPEPLLDVSDETTFK